MNYTVITPLKTKFASARNAFFILSMFLGTALLAQNNTATEKGIFQFETEVIDYGTINQNADGVRAFKFINVGKSPIVITDVKGSCGCTVPSKPDGAIMPGESAEIGVKYATDRIGAFSKTVTVSSNASEGTITLKIKGEVLAAKAENQK